MTLQCAALFAIFVAMEWKEIEFFQWTSLILIWAMLVSTALSGLQYLWKAFALLKKQEQ
ncbi:MAG TPA: hypothetical protein VFE62_28375 [Gemmataceae bacterium]|nr:hypothetical protein [Gemmataceae bacterium]